MCRFYLVYSKKKKKKKIACWHAIFAFHLSLCLCVRVVKMKWVKDIFKIKQQFVSPTEKWENPFMKSGKMQYIARVDHEVAEDRNKGWRARQIAEEQKAEDTEQI